MTTKHTPGPWHVSVAALPEQIHICTPGAVPVAAIGGEAVCDIPAVQETRLANARLIAAAPELAEILRGIYEAATSYGRTSPEWLIERLAPVKELLEKL